MMNRVICTLIEKTNTLIVWKDDVLVGVVAEVEGELRMTIYGVSNKPAVLSFNDLEIIKDNWNALLWRQRIYKNGVDKVV